MIVVPQMPFVVRPAANGDYSAVLATMIAESVDWGKAVF
jgi:hypothetical protein